MPRVRLGAVEYLNARPLIYGLTQSAAFDLRLDTPARCAELLHGGAIDLGLIPSIEYLRAGTADGYLIVPDVAVGSRGPVASVALYTTRAVEDVRSIALDTTSRTSVALTRILCRHAFRIAPELHLHSPALEEMLARCDAALLIGDRALALNGGPMCLRTRNGDRQSPVERHVEKIDLGEVWTRHTGLPFVYAFWAGPPGAVTPSQVRELQRARDAGVRQPEQVAAEYFAEETAQVERGAQYLRDNIRYVLGPEEHAGLERFYEYAVEAGLVPRRVPLRFFAS